LTGAENPLRNLSSIAKRCMMERLERRQMLSLVGPTPVEQYMLQLINRARANPAAEAALSGIDLNEGLTPGTISPDAKQPLAFNPQLIDAARSHNAWMMQHDAFAHNEGATDPGDQMRAAGYLFTGTWSWGQNIAWSGQTPQVPAPGSTAAQEQRDLFVDTTEPGRGHRLNLLEANFKQIGMGVTPGTFQSYNAVLVTQDFAAKSGSSFLLGVAYTDADHTHTYQVGEGLGGLTITATRQGDGAIFTTTTWSAGGYALPLDPGTYSVNASGAGIGSVTQGQVVIGSQNVEADFTPQSAPVSPPSTGGSVTPPPTVPVGWVTGTVFRDRNGNGIKDRGEGGIGRFRVYADLNDDGIWQTGEPSVLTNSRGNFRMALPPGPYVFRTVERPGLVQTTPPGNEFPVTVGSAQTVLGVQFGHRAAPKPPRVRPHHRERFAAGAFRGLTPGQ
jgi:hypothetical protein